MSGRADRLALFYPISLVLRKKFVKGIPKLALDIRFTISNGVRYHQWLTAGPDRLVMFYFSSLVRLSGDELILSSNQNWS